MIDVDVVVLIALRILGVTSHTNAVYQDFNGNSDIQSLRESLLRNKGESVLMLPVS